MSTKETQNQPDDSDNKTKSSETFKAPQSPPLKLNLRLFAQYSLLKKLRQQALNTNTLSEKLTHTVKHCDINVT